MYTIGTRDNFTVHGYAPEIMRMLEESLNIEYDGYRC